MQIRGFFDFACGKIITEFATPRNKGLEGMAKDFFEIHSACECQRKEVVVEHNLYLIIWAYCLLWIISRFFVSEDREK